ncbi:MAG: hypothetical protein ACYTXA_05165 [Nostoc sp.]
MILTSSVFDSASSLKGANLQRLTPKNQVIKKSDSTIIIAIAFGLAVG